jgi:hypothetical protein
MKTRFDAKIILYSFIGATLSLMPVGFLYMMDAKGKNIFTIFLKSLLRLF